MKPVKESLLGLQDYILVNKVLFVVFLVFWLSFGALLGLWGNESMFLWINTHLTPQFSTSAKIGSAVGESLGMLVLLLLSFRKTIRHTALILSSWLIGSCFSWLFKLWLMAGSLRPYEYFSRKGILIQVVDGVVPLRFNHFPSGHTITIFTLLFLVPSIIPELPRRFHIWLLFMMIFSGLSRVLLVHHWPLDVWAGMGFGVAAVLAAYRFMTAVKFPFMEKSLISQLNFRK